MSVPLERIQAVMKKLEQESERRMSLYKDKWNQERNCHMAYSDGLDWATVLLERLVNEHEASDTGRTSDDERDRGSQ